MIKPRNQNTPKTRTSEIIHHSIFSLYTIIIKVQFGLCDAIKIFTQSVYLQPSQKNLKGVQSFYRQSAYLQKDPTGLKEKLLYLKSIRKKEKNEMSSVIQPQNQRPKVKIFKGFPTTSCLLAFLALKKRVIKTWWLPVRFRLCYE